MRRIQCYGTTTSLGMILLLAMTACGTDGRHEQDRNGERASSDEMGPDVGSCVAAENTFGLADLQLSGAITEARSDDAHFGLTPDSTSFYLMITEPEIGHFELEFKTPGRPEYPKPGMYRVGTAAGPGSGLTAGLRLFLEDEYVEFAPQEGGLTIERVDSTGVCGTLDVVWSSTAFDSLTLKTTGEFQAVLNRYAAPPLLPQEDWREMQSANRPH